MSRCPNCQCDLNRKQKTFLVAARSFVDFKNYIHDNASGFKVTRMSNQSVIIGNGDKYIFINTTLSSNVERVRGCDIDALIVLDPSILTREYFVTSILIPCMSQGAYNKLKL